jgi:outer membrane receptor for Fe3+-dicitrate
VTVVATGIDQHGQALEFYYESAPELLVQAEELRAAEVGHSSSKDRDSNVPSISLDTEHGIRTAESAASSGIGGGGLRRSPRTTTRQH